MGSVVFVTCLLTVVAVSSYWVHQTVLDTNRYVATVKPIGRDPEVTEALSIWMSDQLLKVVNAQKVISEALPEQARILAAPLASAVQAFVQQQIDKVLQSSAFEKAWVVANTTAHATAVAILRNKTRTDVVRTSNGKVVLNLLPLFNEALRQVQTASPDILGRDIQLPEIKSTDIPADARKKISDALGVTVPGNFGEIVLFDSSDLHTAQRYVTLSDRLVVVVIILAVLALAFAVWVSHRRRRTIIQLGILTAILFVVFRRSAMFGKNKVLDKIKVDTYRRGVNAGISDILNKYLDLTAWLIFIALLTAAVAFLSGPHPRAVQIRRTTRRWLREAASEVARAGAEHHDDPIVHWLVTNHVALQVGGAVAVGLGVLVLNLSPVSLFLFVVLLAVYEFILYFLAAGRDSVPSIFEERREEIPTIPVGELGPARDAGEAGEDARARGEEDAGG